MMNIYIVDYYTVIKRNGLNTYVTQLQEQLSKQPGINLNFVWTDSTVSKTIEKKMVAGVTHYYLPGHIAAWNDPNRFDQKAADYLAQETAGKENIIFHFNWVNHCPFGHLLKQKINCITLLTKHCIPWRDMISNRYPTFLRLNTLMKGKGSPLSIISPVLMREKWFYESMDHIIAVTASGKQSLTKILRYPANKVSVIYNGISIPDLQKMQQKKAILRARYNIPANEKVILFAGAVTDKKGAFDLARTFDQLVSRYPGKSWRLIFAGAGDHSKLLEAIKTSWSKITLTGNLSRKQLYEFYGMSDIGIVPSYIEQCSYTAIEMMSAGLPVIVANVDGLKEMVPDGCGLKVKLNLADTSAGIDAKDLSRKILYLIENEDIASNYGQQAKVYAKNQFSVKRMIGQTIATYEKLIHDKASENIRKVKILMPPPLVSVILPIYNGAAYIGECLDSILHQTWKNFEIIIVDDGSTDNSASIIEKYDDPRIRYTRNSQNKGIVYSLNKGLSQAQGKYIARIDSDDKMHSSRLEKQVQYLEAHPDISLVGSWHYLIDSNGKTIGLKEYPAEDPEIKALLPFMNPFSHPTTMMRRVILNSYQYSDEYKYCEDYELWIRINESHKTANIPDCLTFYRISSNNIREEYLKTQKQNTIELLSGTFDQWGIDHTVEELALHAAIGTSNARLYFIPQERSDALKTWVTKILERRQEQHDFPQNIIKAIGDFLIYDYCAVAPDLKKRKRLSVV